MECGIFFILASCAFQAVFADDSLRVKGDIYGSDDEEKFSRLDGKIFAPVWEAAGALEIEGLTSLDIAATCIFGQPEQAKYVKQHRTAFYQGKQCYEKQHKTEDTKAARKSCDQIYAALEKQGNLARDQCLACYTKCAKLGADCKQMIKSIDDDGRKNDKNTNGTEENKNRDINGGKVNKN